MATQKSGFEKWQDTINGSKTDKRWNDHDATIAAAIKEFDTHLGETKGYAPLSWKLIKAMVWTESGGPDSPWWKSRAIQIGNPGDLGLDALLGDKEGGDLILPPAMKPKITKASINTADINIMAGIGYLLMRAASYEVVSVPDPRDTKTFEVPIKPRDSLALIAEKNQSTVEMLKFLNPNLSPRKMKVGDPVSVRKASMQKVIKGWSKIDTRFAAENYNVGDPMYFTKLEFCLKLIG